MVGFGLAVPVVSAIVRYPVSAYSNRGNAKEDFKQYEAAIDDYDGMSRLNPKQAKAYCNVLMTSRKGISSLQLSKEIGVTQQTAWFMLHRLRLACRNNLQQLQGEGRRGSRS